VIDSLVSFYQKDNANVHRGVHALSWRASEAYDQSRARVHRFLNAAKHDHIVFTRGTTDETGEKIGFTRERVRQLQLRALRQLKRTLKQEGIEWDSEGEDN
jgi:DNA-directed RNA polymerase sigma subunit (sigma70/sigma32)